MIPNHLRSWGWLIDKSSFFICRLHLVCVENFSYPHQLTTDKSCGILLIENFIVALSPWGIPEVPGVPSNSFLHTVALGVRREFSLALVVATGAAVVLTLCGVGNCSPFLAMGFENCNTRFGRTPDGLFRSVGNLWFLFQKGLDLPPGIP